MREGKQMKKFFKTYFRRDNLRFLIKLFSPIIGFALSNISLILMFMRSSPWCVMGLTVVSIICVIAAAVVLFQKYQYYHGLAEHLRKKDKQLFLICSYISKTSKFRQRKIFNNFEIANMNIIYDINVAGVYNAHRESDIDFEVTYEIKSAINKGNTCAKVYHCSLAKNNNSNVTAKYTMGNNEFQNMDTDIGILNDSNVKVWYGLTESAPLKHNQFFHYSIKLSYKKAFHLMKENYFLVDPRNYGRSVNDINIVIRSKNEELGKLMRIPTITTYRNGMNTNDINGQVHFRDERRSDYGTYFTHTVHPNADDLIYVFEVIPQFMQNEII